MATTMTTTMTTLQPVLEAVFPVDNVERIVLSVLAKFQPLVDLEIIDARPENLKLYRSLFDFITQTKTTAAEDEKASRLSTSCPSILNDPRIAAIGPTLWDLWGGGEYIVEREFAKTVVAGASHAICRATLNSYTSLAKYRQIARMEVNAIDTALGEYGLPPVQKMALLGSGPMPYTSLCFQERYGPSVSFLNVDRNPEAIELGSKVVESCGFTNIAFKEADVSTLTSLAEYDVVHFAALIGATPEQRRDLIVAVAGCMRPGALLLVRSTDGLRQLLYPPANMESPEIRSIVTPVVATRYFGGASSLSVNVGRVEGPGAPGSFHVPQAHI